MLRSAMVMTTVLIMTIVGCQEDAVRLEANKAVVRQWVTALNADDIDHLSRIVRPDFVRHSQATPDVAVTSLEDFIRFHRQTLETFPDAEASLDQIVAEGDRVAFWGTYTGTQEGPMGPWPATGKRVEFDMAGVFRLEEGQIAELWITWDNMAGLAQLGLLPEPAADSAAAVADTASRQP